MQQKWLEGWRRQHKEMKSHSMNKKRLVRVQVTLGKDYKKILVR